MTVAEKSVKECYSEGDLIVDDLLVRMQNIFRDVFDTPELEIAETTTAHDVPGWDSLSNINLICALECEFQVRFGLGEVQKLNNVGQMANLIRAKAKSQARI